MTSLRELALPGLDRADALVGAAIERAVCRHHHRRLHRIGREVALEAPPGWWATQASPPTPGNTLDLHVDGEDALRAIAEALDGAERRVHLAGWFFSPGFRLVRDGSDERTLAERLAQIARRAEVRVLAWAGAPLPLFRPSRETVREALAGLRLDSRVQVAADARERPLHCHHEKLVIVDDELAFVGGIDLTDLAGDRFDRSGHPARADIGWHDAAAELRGPAVGDVAAHFALRWCEVTGERLDLAPRPDPAGSHEVQVVRTVPENVYDALPRGEFSILEAYTGALRAAQRLVYVENQFLWSPEIVELLADKLRRPPTDGFRLVAVLPARPNNGGDDTRGALGVLMEADAGHGRLLACCRLALGSGEARSVYVHAKIAIVDDEWWTIGSANLNEHSLFNDTEMNLVTRSPALARATRRRLWGEHLDCSPDELDGDPAAIVDGWLRPVAEEQLRRRQAGLAPTHGLVQLPHVSRRARRLRGPIDGLLVDG